MPPTIKKIPHNLQYRTPHVVHATTQLYLTRARLHVLHACAVSISNEKIAEANLGAKGLSQSSAMVLQRLPTRSEINHQTKRNGAPMDMSPHELMEITVHIEQNLYSH